jgi:hypothetical protein
MLGRWVARSLVAAVATFGAIGAGQATQFSTFTHYDDPYLGTGGPYSGKIYVTNNRNESLCVSYTFYDNSGNTILTMARPMEVGAKQVRAALQGPGAATATMHFWIFAAHEGHCRWNVTREQIHMGRGNSGQGKVAIVNSSPRGTYSFDGSRWQGKQGDEVNVIVN